MLLSKRLPLAAVAGVAALTVAAAALSAPPTEASAADGYTVTVGGTGSWTTPDDTPAAGYIDKDGSYYFQQAHSLYGSTQERKWSFFTGSTMDTASLSTTLTNSVNPSNPNDSNKDTTWRCNNSPTGLIASSAPSTASYSQRNFCDLAGVWVDPDTGSWYGLVHNEFTPQPYGDGVHFDGIDLAVSTDQGMTWQIKSRIITSPYGTSRGNTTDFPQQSYYYGDGDPRLVVDAASGYFYVYYGSRVVDKNGGWAAFQAHVARAPLSGKMAAGSWQKWYNGQWNQPGVGGQESNMVPVSTSNTTGYTPASAEYSPNNTGSVAQQVAAGTTPPTSPLFVMDVSWNAYLGLWIGEPQAVDQSGNAPQQIYATSDLTTQKWTLLGDTGAYHTASWYRWFLDPVSKTSSSIVGKDVRMYCSFGCSGGKSGEYVNVSLGGPAAAPVDTSKAYQLGAGGRLLAQATTGTAVTSTTSDNGRAAWRFTATGDGAYTITNTSTGALLGVNSTANSGRAWGAALTAGSPGTPTVGQQWWVLQNRSSANNSTDGTYRIVNRYSGLVIALSSATGRLAETTPARSWTDASGSTVGGSRTADEQRLSLTVVGSAGTLDGAHSISSGGRSVDDPNHSTTAGTQLVLWTSNTGANQSWLFTSQTDGSYTLKNGESGLCADVSGGSTAAGAQVIQWTCMGGTNQRWTVTPQSGGSYTITSVKSGLLLSATTNADGTGLTQQSPSSGMVQSWSIL
ncbi:RICIN domain-containing protein [Arthrobacter sp. NPDC090010]|uniref:RICIN domain-containing protein n=1 Tax=Arthrobacter sp. NPDC090010 TaxID=3363942 RepID=UPI0038204447